MTTVVSPPEVAKQSETPPSSPVNPSRVGRYFESGARWIMLADIVILPWLIGGNYGAVEGIAMLLTLIAYALWGVSLFLGGRTTPVVFPAVGLIVCLGVGLGVAAAVAVQRANRLHDGSRQLEFRRQPDVGEIAGDRDVVGIVRVNVGDERGENVGSAIL